MAPLPLFVDFFLEKRTHIRSMWFPLYRTFPHCIGHLQSLFDSLEHSESSFRFDHLNKGWHLVAMAGRTEFHDYLPRDHIQALYTWSRKISNYHDRSKFYWDSECCVQNFQSEEKLYYLPIIQCICRDHIINGICCCNDVRDTKEQVCDDLKFSEFPNFS